VERCIFSHIIIILFYYWETTYLCCYCTKRKTFFKCIVEKFKNIIVSIINIAAFWRVVSFTVNQGETPLLTASVLTQSTNRQNRRKFRNTNILLILFVSRKLSAEMEVLEIQSDEREFFSGLSAGHDSGGASNDSQKSRVCQGDSRLSAYTTWTEKQNTTFKCWI